MSEAHSKIGASNAARWIACPGSVRLCASVDRRPPTEYAALGTVAHSLCEFALTQGTDPAAFLGQRIRQDGFDILVDQTVVDGVNEYVSTVRAVLEQEGGKLLVENSFSLAWLHPDMFGRNDACILPPDTFGTLYVFDYKNGRNPVGVNENPQLMYYALGALGQHNDDLIQNVVVFIVQPNSMGGEGHVKRWEISTEELYKWAEEVLAPAAKRTQDPDAPLCPGDHCVFCDAASSCPARMNDALALLDPPSNGSVAELPAVDAIPPERLGALSAFFNSATFKAWQKALVESEYDLLSRGVAVPGRKLVEKTVRGNRKWRDEAEVLAAFREYGESIMDSKLKSPSQMEKALSAFIDKKEAKEKVADLVTRDESVEYIVVSDYEAGDDAKKAIDLFN